MCEQLEVFLNVNLYLDSSQVVEAPGELRRKGSRICERDRICPIYYEYLISKQISEGVKLLTLENMFLTCKTDHKSFKAESSLVFKNNNV